MDMTLLPAKLSGTVTAPPSKSMAHRLLICAAFAKTCSDLICPQINEDIAATAEGLNRICHAVVRTDYGYDICPYQCEGDCGPDTVYINCRESGSTLRSLLPIVGALGIDTIFEMEGRLPQRPLSPLWEEMERMGCTLSRPTESMIRCSGQLRPGHYRMDGSVSSQFISGLMMALPLIEGETSLEITGSIESMPYIEMTRYVLDLFKDGCPERIEVEGDWSSAAFWLAANALGSQVAVTGLNTESPQGDREIVHILSKLEEMSTIFCGDIPDLVPILAVVAAAKKGAVFTDIRRLRLKESDRVASTIAMLENLGGKAEATENTITVYGTGLNGGTVNSYGDHRIAMAAAIAATVCKEPVTILGAECVKKSYPAFWEDYSHLGGNYGETLR
jgi:3-phosphoshikimate 1-carboxyvinyltransferase